MAIPPKSRKINVPPGKTVDVNGEAVPTQEQMDGTVAQLNDFMDAVKNALEGGLSQENFRRQVKTVRINPNQTYPYSFDCTLSVRPVAIRPVQVVTVSGTAPTTAIDTTQWQMRDTKTIEFLRIPGLPTDGTFDVTLFIE